MSFDNELNPKILSRLGQRGTLGITLTNLASKIENLMVITADLANTSGLDRFQKRYPKKFVNVGISEQNMIGVGAGLASEGYIPFATTFATFASMRCLEQVRVNMGYMGLNVKLVGLASGYAMGQFGNTHYGIEDIAIMRAIPNIVVLSPADCVEVVKTIESAAVYDGPVYIRLTGTMNNPIVNSDDYSFQIGSGIELCTGSDVVIFATGSMVHYSLESAKILCEMGIRTTVINIHTIKPLDTVLINHAIKNKTLIVTVEEHNIIGGLGSAISEYISTLTTKPRMLFIGVNDIFCKAGTYKYLLEKNGLTTPHIVKNIFQYFKEI